MTDVFTPEKRSWVMSRIKGKNTGLEKLVFAAVRRERIHFMRHVKNVPGRPDLVRLRDKKAVFIDGDFWHGWKFNKWKQRLPEFWQDKIAQNIARDKRNFARLKRGGWTYIRVWEHELEKRPDKTLARIIEFLRLGPPTR